jgi:hypothetical protein
MRNEPATLGDADFHAALRQGRALETLLDEAETARLHAFHGNAFLDRLDAEQDFTAPRSRADSWISRFNSLGITTPVVAPLSERWWSLDRRGKAVCAVLYASGIVYEHDENPIFGAWHPDTGGGGPQLTENDAHIFDAGWREDNLDFLRRTLAPTYLVERLIQASALLAGHDGGTMAARVLRDVEAAPVRVESRSAELIEELAKPELEKTFWD